MTLAARGLDFAWASQIAGVYEYIIEDTRFDYGEKRFVSLGNIKGRLCVVVWTPRNSGRHIISMRKANDREQKNYSIWAGSQ
jgi:uncharacterized protein